ncbi:MAG TPA: aspartyl/asparaginyl beta-hydroxylase domain-containing protein [Candidatus Dormibacteraeota bacterium]|nr:aspartyl/asparaginyl beta-hydroxylase domain-containing protein [Candidatus Dormibacteraeota bacterium]
MRTQMLGRLNLDAGRLSEELDRSRTFEYAEQYPEFQSGSRPWQTCMLWSAGGEVGDGVIARYDMSSACQPTVFGERLTYLREVVERHFVVEHLLFGRLVVMTDNVLVPHRDFVEFTERSAEARATHRLHVPLATGADCLFLEDNVVYRMLPGEVWSLDVTRLHSAAVLSGTRRVHLILDFADVPDDDLLRFARARSAGIPEHSLVERPPLSDGQRDALLGLSGVIDCENLKEVFGLVIRKHYRRDGGQDFVWTTMRAIARASGDAEVGARIEELFRHCTLEREE